MKEPIRDRWKIPHPDEKGLSILDVLIAASLLAVGILAVASMQMTAIQGNTTSRDLTQATNWAQDRLEQLVTLPYSSTDLASGTHTDLNPPDGYVVSWTVSNGAVANTKNISLTVQWQNQSQNRTLTMASVKAQL